MAKYWVDMTTSVLVEADDAGTAFDKAMDAVEVDMTKVESYELSVEVIEEA